MRAQGVMGMARELGVAAEAPIVLFSDSPAARAFASRRGVGRMRHLEARRLWFQSQVADRNIVLMRIAGEANPADVLTKYHHEREAVKHLASLGIQWVSRHLWGMTTEGV